MYRDRGVELIDRAYSFRGGTEVANVYGSSCHTGNWKQYWINNMDEPWPQVCQIATPCSGDDQRYQCSRAATVGGHMYVRAWNDKSLNWIIPICSKHNKQETLDCGNEECNLWVVTKDSASGVKIVQNE